MMLTSRPALAVKPAFVHLLVAAVFFFSLYALFFNTGGGLVGTLGRQSTLTGRTYVWERVFKFVENPMLGTGYESFWVGNRLERMREVDRDLNQAHNGYIEVYLNLGWVGLALIASVMVTGYRKIVFEVRRDADVGSLRLAYFVVGVLYNCTEAAFKMRDPVWIFFLIACCAIPRRATTKKPDPETDSRRPRVFGATCPRRNYFVGETEQNPTGRSDDLPAWIVSESNSSIY
jgi:O-antigen ligase